MAEVESINYCMNDYGGPSNDIDFCVCPQDSNKVELLQRESDKLLEQILMKEKPQSDREAHAPVNNSGLFLICTSDVDNSLKPWFKSSEFLSATTVFTNFTTPFDAVPRNHSKIIMEILKNKKS